jgi:hypothetical protein
VKKEKKSKEQFHSNVENVVYSAKSRCYRCGQEREFCVRAVFRLQGRLMCGDCMAKVLAGEMDP